MKEGKTYQLLSRDEVKTIVLGALMVAGEAGLTKDQLFAACDWAEGVRIDNGLLENVLAGNMGVNIKDDGQPVFQMLPKGEREAEALIAEAGGV